MKNLRSNLPLLLIALLFGFMALYLGPNQSVEEISYSEFVDLLSDSPQQIEKASFEENGNKARLIMNDDRVKEVRLPKSFDSNKDVLDLIEKAKVPVKVIASETDRFLWLAVNFLLPILFMVVLLFLVFRGMKAGGGQIFSFIRNKAKLFKEPLSKITFADVAGADEVKRELQEVVQFLKNSEKFKALGAKIPKGVLLVGPPGTGKTLLARAVAGEAGVPFFSISGSDFVEMFVGVGASRVRDLFEQARKQAPCIVFVDEIDAVGRQRGISINNHDEREQTLNQLLVEMDGFEPTASNVIVLAATNRPDVLDNALTRPGRFDRQVTIDYPDSQGREEILKVHAKGKTFSNNVDLKIIAKRTPGFSGAQLENLLNESALIAAGSSKDSIDRESLDQAVEKICLGFERRSLSIPYKELKMTAYHETGHALVAMTDENMPLHKVTIIPRSMALGVTWSLSKDDYIHWTKRSLLLRIKVALAGMVAEELVFNDTTSGVVADLEGATKIARQMVTQFGMSSVLGPVSLGQERENFLGSFGYEKNYSEETARNVDGQIKEIIEHCYQEVKQMLTEQREVMDAVALVLIDKETLDSDEVKEIIEKVQNNTFNLEEAQQKAEDRKRKIEEKRAI